MLTIINPTNNRQTDYSKHYLATEAKHAAKHAADSDGKCRAWGIRAVADQITLRVDYLTIDGWPQSVHIAL